MTAQTNLFGDDGRVVDSEGLIADVEMTTRSRPLIARPARVGFLAGMLSTWTLGPGVTPNAAEKEAFLEIARDALERAFPLERQT